MRKGVCVALLLLAALGVYSASAVPADASTRCEDGWLSPSEGGSGTCSWHGGIADDDYSYSPDGPGTATATHTGKSSGFRWTTGWTVLAVLVALGVGYTWGEDAKSKNKDRRS